MKCLGEELGDTVYEILHRCYVSSHEVFKEMAEKEECELEQLVAAAVAQIVQERFDVFQKGAMN